MGQTSPGSEDLLIFCFAYEFIAYFSNFRGACELTEASCVGCMAF